MLRGWSSETVAVPRGACRLTPASILSSRAWSEEGIPMPEEAKARSGMKASRIMITASGYHTIESGASSWRMSVCQLLPG